MLEKMHTGAIVSLKLRTVKLHHIITRNLIPSYRLNHTYEDKNVAVVENDLEMNLTAHLKFLLPLRNYRVENGEILLERESNDMVEIYVSADIEKESEETITLY